MLTQSDGGKVLRAFMTRNYATHFVFENACVSYVAPLSYYPEEDELLFPPLSRFHVREVEQNFPRNPDKVTLVYLSLESHAPSARGSAVTAGDIELRRSSSASSVSAAQPALP
eukprot:RCo026662